MGCYRPIDVWPAPPPLKGLVFSPHKSFAGAVASQIPCGKCIGCRIDRKDEWRTRLILEGKQHECASFVTLTYSGEHLPSDYSLSKHHAQTWVKRLRRVIEPLQIRFFMCGEYGDKNLRPHYHAIIFGYDFPDRVPWRTAASGEVAFRSELLEKTWPLGHSEIGSFTPKSAGYVAGYALKKQVGKHADNHYRRLNPSTGEINQVLPEFVLMSRNPGIGRGWYDEFARDAFPSDFLIIDGVKKPVPRYFKRLLDNTDEATAFKVEVARKKAGRKPSRDKHWTRIVNREEHAEYLESQRKPKELD
jgi:hypothetical protein